LVLLLHEARAVRANSFRISNWQDDTPSIAAFHELGKCLAGQVESLCSVGRAREVGVRRDGCRDPASKPARFA